MEPSKIYLSAPHMGDNELKYIHEAFDTNWISTVGPQINAFEKQLSEYTGVESAAALASGTAAIHLALQLLGIGPGDLVFCQSFTFAASANPITYQGAHPIFIDSEPETWNMDPQALEDAIKAQAGTLKRMAIIPVHLYGMPANMPAIMEVAGRYNIPVIEDAAEALGSHINDQMCGSWGDLGILSFNGNKIITTSGGGALLSNHSDYISRAKFLATQARDQAPHYEHTQIGYNYRMGNINAAIGMGQMDVLNERIKRRREIFSTYLDTLGSKYQFQLVSEELSGGGASVKLYSNRWLTTILTSSFEERESIRLALEKENIETRPLWKPMHLQPVFKDAYYFGGKVCEDLFDRGLCLPSGSGMSREEFDRVLTALEGI